MLSCSHVYIGSMDSLIDWICRDNFQEKSEKVRADIGDAADICKQQMACISTSLPDIRGNDMKNFPGIIFQRTPIKLTFYLKVFQKGKKNIEIALNLNLQKIKTYRKVLPYMSAL